MSANSRLSVRSASHGNAQARSRPDVARLEALERRLLLHNPLIIGVTADNRGEVLVKFDAAAAEIDPAGFNKQSVRMLSAGADGVLGTADDERIPASVRYRPEIQRLLVRAVDMEPGTSYLVRVVSTRVPVAPGFRIDGEFNGTFPSGDGIEGGNFEFQVKHDRSQAPRVRMSTSEGPILLTMRADDAPYDYDVRKFHTYADRGDYDDTFFSRSVPGLAIQAGSLQVRNNQAVEWFPSTVTSGPLTAISNTRGTLAWSKPGIEVGSTDFPDINPELPLPGVGGRGNEFFFNLADNGEAPNWFDQLSNHFGTFGYFYGRYEVFAEVTTAEGLAVVDAIAAKPRADLTGVMGPFAHTAVMSVPVQDQTDVANLDPMNDLVIIRRMARIRRVVPLPPPS